MTDKTDLIKQAIELQDAINSLFLKYRAENWLSLNLTMAQLKSIIYISLKGKANFKELAEALEVTPSVVTGIVDRLTSHGLVKRRRLGTTPDRRMQWLVVTGEGQDLLNNIRQQTSDNLSRILEAMGPDDLSALVRGFSALVRAAESHLRKQHMITGPVDMAPQAPAEA